MANRDRIGQPCAHSLHRQWHATAVRPRGVGEIHLPDASVSQETACKLKTATAHFPYSRRRMPSSLPSSSQLIFLHKMSGIYVESDASDNLSSDKDLGENILEDQNEIDLVEKKV